MTKTPGEQRPATAEHEALEELGDDAIIAQQAAVHTPQPRANVEIESRSIVIAEERPAPEGRVPPEGEPTRELMPYAVSSMDPTVVIRDRKFINSLGSSPPSTRERRGRRVARVALWCGAGLLAFGVGGILAVLTTRRPVEPAIDATLQHSAPTAPLVEPVAERPQDPVLAPEPATPVAVQEPRTAVAQGDAARELAAKPALSASDLPVEKAPAARARATK
ncbi:MAG TPA: hypothetical protein VI072_04170 [Polyangiaceae bacterium]